VRTHRSCDEFISLRAVIKLAEGSPIILIEEVSERALQVGSAIVVLVASLILIIVAISRGHYFGAAAWGLGCFAIEVCIFGFSRPWGDDKWLFSALAASAAAMGILSELTGSRATDSRRQSAQLDLMRFYIELLGGLYEGGRLLRAGWRNEKLSSAPFNVMWIFRI